ncbi:MAG TPA: Asp-tRNA(Asn)/Glu-tRNA(Gln) amidotransferase subunit GatC, partial [Rhabdochlamydiaceae bacterium]|nr:Asp-tRNA(Asn)/Glu-tRNA(Gln) amidotransferase subunit GatC [Rhabdochlamydiaceae bacterium]
MFFPLTITIISYAIMNEDDFKSLSHLCRISCTEEEKMNFLKSLDNILTYIEQLQEVNTEGVEACYTVLETLSNVMREDLPEEPLSRDLFL